MSASSLKSHRSTTEGRWRRDEAGSIPANFLTAVVF
jgi:hypothetical protein